MAASGIATSRNKYVHSANTENNTCERNRKSNDVHHECFKLSNKLSPLQNNNQNLTTKRRTSTIPNIHEKILANNRNTSPHVTNTVRNKIPHVCTTENYLKNFRAVTVPGSSD